VPDSADVNDSQSNQRFRLPVPASRLPWHAASQFTITRLPITPLDGLVKNKNALIPAWNGHCLLLILR
jgi:hypothetical protein